MTKLSDDLRVVRIPGLDNDFTLEIRPRKYVQEIHTDHTVDGREFHTPGLMREDTEGLEEMFLTDEELEEFITKGKGMIWYSQ